MRGASEPLWSNPEPPLACRDSGIYDQSGSGGPEVFVLVPVEGEIQHPLPVRLDCLTNITSSFKTPDTGHICWLYSRSEDSNVADLRLFHETAQHRSTVANPSVQRIDNESNRG